MGGERSSMTVNDSTDTEQPPRSDDAIRTTRFPCVDIVKAIAIGLVVYGHVQQGLIHRQWVTNDIFSLADAAIYSFHMPAFFVVAGLFVERSMRRGPQSFLLDKARTILYPWLLWGAITVATGPLIDRFRFSGGHPGSIFDSVLWVITGDQSWFLPTLFVTLVLAVATRGIRSDLRIAIALILALVLPDFGITALDKGFRDFVFVAVGQYLAQRVTYAESVPIIQAAAASCILIVIQIGLILLDRMPGRAMTVVLGLSGTAMLFALARVVRETRVGKALLWIGPASIAVFLLHPFVVGAARYVIVHTPAHTNAAAQLIVPTMAGVILPAILWHYRGILRIGWLFQLSRPANERA